MKAEAAISTELRDLLEKASSWRLLGLLFERPRPGWSEELEALALALPAEESTLSAAVESAKTEAREGVYHTILGPGGPASPREATHRAWVLPGQLLSELNGYYENFAYLPKTEEPLDHVSVEVGFMSYLLLKQAYALEQGQTEQAQVTWEAAQRFASEHLREIAEPLAASLEPLGIRYLALASGELFRRTGPKPPSPGIPSSLSEEEGCPFDP